MLVALSLTAVLGLSAAAAPGVWKLEVYGFGTVSTWQLLEDAGGRTYIGIKELAEALRLGIDSCDGTYTLRWGGKEAKLKEGSLALSGKALSSPVCLQGGKICFPVRDLEAFGVKLAADEKSKTVLVTVPRSVVASMEKASTEGPSLFTVRLSFAPAKIESFVLSAPDRLVIDLYETTVEPAVSMDVKSSEVTRMRASMNRPGVARVVLELTKSGSGAKVYQDPYDPSLVRISYPGAVKSVEQAEVAGVRGFLIGTTAPVRDIRTSPTKEGLVLELPDVLPDKGLNTAGVGYSAQAPKHPWTELRLEPGPYSFGAASQSGNSLFIPLLSDMTSIRAYTTGALTIEFCFSAGIKMPEIDIQDDGISLTVKGIGTALPMNRTGLLENRIEVLTQGTGTLETRITIRGTKSGNASATLEDEGRRLVLSFGGVMEAVDVFKDNGVRRLTFKFSGLSAPCGMKALGPGSYLLEFPGLGSVKEKAAASGLEDSGKVSWIQAAEGLKCMLELSAGKVAVQRSAQTEGTFVVDIGYELTGCAVESANGTSRIRLTSSGPIDAQVFRLREPDRLVVDLPGFVEGRQKYDEILKGGVLRVRSGQNTIGVARLVFDLDRYIGHTWSSLAEGFGIDIELAEKLAGLSGRLILIDPGHGGKDGGAVGNNLKEKDVNLDISLKLRDLLEAQGAVVVMTRSDDIKVELIERSNIANLLLPDAVVCIHSNSVISQLPNGTETYYFSNEALSRELADSVHKSLVDRIRLANRGLFKKEYYMVKETYSPSVLVEVGFLSNAQDAVQLADQAFRSKAAEGIYDGLISYFSGSAQESWAPMRETLYLASTVPAYQGPAALWPGLYIERPWKAELPPDMTSLAIDQEQDGK